MPTTHLLYLHGFRSSPASNKARLSAAAVASRHPGAAIKLLPHGDHALSDFEQHLDQALDFLQLI